jgi:hypothetical protein
MSCDNSVTSHVLRQSKANFCRRQIVYFILRPYFVHINMSPIQNLAPPQRTNGAPPGANSLRTSALVPVQTGSWAHQASYPAGTEGPSPGVRACRVVTLTTPI